MLSRVLHPGSNRIGVALLKYLRSLGERYLDPFFFSPGASVELLTVLPLSEKKIKKRFLAIYRGSIRKWGLVFRIIRKLECVDNFSKRRPEEMASGVGCLARNGFVGHRRVAYSALPQLTVRSLEPVFYSLVYQYHYRHDWCARARHPTR